jgi:hypothetical protein
MATKGDRYLIYADKDDRAIKVHGPMSAEQAEGFFSGVEWANDEALEYLGVYNSIDLARQASNAQVRDSFPHYEVVEMNVEEPQLAVSQGSLFLLYLDGDYDRLKIHGPLSLGRAEGFQNGVYWVNDSSLEYLGVYAGAEVARLAAQEYGIGEYEIEELAVALGRLPAGIEI